MKRVWKVRIQPVVEGTRHDFDERGEYNIGRGCGKCPPARLGMGREQRRFSGHGIKTQIFGDHCFSGGARGSPHFNAQCPGSGNAPAKSQQPKDDDSNPPKLDPKLILEANQKEIKKNVERLYDLASELKAEVEKTDAVHVLSVAMLRKTDEIEKLAKEIRSRAKG